LSNAGHPQVRDAGRRLNNLRSVRNWADYDLARPLPEGLAHDQANEAITVVEVLDDLKNTPDILADVIAVVRDYERDVLGEVTFRGP
jgi:hypothetical protein